MVAGIEIKAVVIAVGISAVEITFVGYLHQGGVEEGERAAVEFARRGAALNERIDHRHCRVRCASIDGMMKLARQANYRAVGHENSRAVVDLEQRLLAAVAGKTALHRARSHEDSARRFEQRRGGGQEKSS